MMASSSATLEQWAMPRLAQLLPLDDDSLRQIISYTDSLPKDAAAEHLKNLLGDGAASLEFISSFNLRRKSAPQSTAASGHAQTNASTSDAPPRARPGAPKKKKANIHTLPPRQIDRGAGTGAGAYQKRDEEDYMPGSGSAQRQQRHKDQVAENLALREKSTSIPLITDPAPSSKRAPATTTKVPPSAAGPLISDVLAPKKAGSSNKNSRTSSPAPAKTKVSITGGTAMHGASTALSDLDSAIRSLEMQTNPTHAAATSNADRMCNCMATRHPLLDMAPNCLSCGKVICVKQGLGPCTFCGTPLLSSEEIQKVLRVLKDERGEERMKANNAAHKRADVSQGKPRAYTGRDFLASALASSSATASPLSSRPATPNVQSDNDDDEATAKAKAHRDKLLNFQANNARRTHIRDEAADFDIPTAGTNMWASPAERAQQLKRQQKVLREMEWHARPDHEKRRVVASIDLVGGRIVKRMAEVEMPKFEDSDDGEGAVEVDELPSMGNSVTGGGAFSANPLAKGLIRPIARETREKGKAAVEEEGIERRKRTAWRRVQMDEDDDNEKWILDGGVYGGEPGKAATDEPERS